MELRTRRKSQPVEIIGVDTERLEKDDTYRDAYAFYIALSGEADYVWQSYLAKWDSALESMRRRILVEGDRLRLVFVYGDNVQTYASYVASLVKWVNERIAEHNEKIAALEKERLQKERIDLTKEEQMLRQLRNVKPEPVVSFAEATIKQLIAAYENDMVAYERYRNNTLKLKGFVNRIEDSYIVLADEYKSRKTVLCVFDRAHKSELKRLRTGKMITVKGEFEGSVVQLSMRHCTLVT